VGDNLAANVHERVDQLVEPVCGARKRNDEGSAIEVFIGKIKKSYDAVKELFRWVIVTAWKEGAYLSRSIC
jgi:hypothetical protein